MHNITIKTNITIHIKTHLTTIFVYFIYYRIHQVKHQQVITIIFIISYYKISLNKFIIFMADESFHAKM